MDVELHCGYTSFHEYVITIDPMVHYSDQHPWEYGAFIHGIFNQLEVVDEFVPLVDSALRGKAPVQIN